VSTRPQNDPAVEPAASPASTARFQPDSANRFKRGLRARQVQIGLWSSLCSPLVAEVIAGAGFDWIVIDAEHAPNELSDVVH
jgi:2-keto-3-deoxy-L-rhamnonate aldolase RhmA